MSIRVVGLLLLGALGIIACQDNSPTTPLPDTGPAFARKATAPIGTPAERTAVLVDRVNARLQAAGSTVRLDGAYFFTAGPGVDDFRRLRNGPRWANPRSVTYAIDPNDIVQHTLGDPFTDADVINALVSAHETYNNVPNIVLHSDRVAHPGTNVDILDAIVLNGSGECVDIVDVTAVNLVSYDPATGALDFNPIADNLFGGWLPPQYFENCLGSALIIGVTWFFSDVDGAAGDGRDGYRDQLYTEQFYNPVFHYNVTGSIYLDFSPTALFDIETIVVHEVGHTHGLGHFGGPNVNQPFKLRPNGRVFSPEAVMNPFYIGGEQRELLPTDIAGLRALYSRKSLE